MRTPQNHTFNLYLNCFSEKISVLIFLCIAYIETIAQKNWSPDHSPHTTNVSVLKKFGIMSDGIIRELLK